MKGLKVESAHVLLAVVEDLNLKVEKDFQMAVVQLTIGPQQRLLIGPRFVCLVMHQERLK